MATKDVDVSVTSEEAKVFLDDAIKPFMTRPGKKTIPVAEGSHDLGFDLRGAPGSAYSVEITSPDESKRKRAGNFDGRGATVGTMPFVVGAK